MLELKRLNGEQVLLNPDQIMWIESTPDTVITMTSGAKLTVKDSCAEVSKKFAAYKRSLNFAKET